MFSPSAALRVALYVTETSWGDESVWRGPSQTKTDTCFPKLHSPSLGTHNPALCERKLSPQNSTGTLPETIPENILRTEQRHRERERERERERARFIPDAPKISTLSHPSRARAASFTFFSGAPVMSQLLTLELISSSTPTNQALRYFIIATEFVFPVS